jgi:coatomer subunit beta'
MDASGKIIWARHNEVQTVNVKSLGSDYELTDGERLPLAVKDLGACDLYPQVRLKAWVGWGLWDAYGLYFG